MKNMSPRRRNSDEEIRRLARSGQPKDKVKLAYELIRSGQTPIEPDLLRVLLEDWLEAKGEGHGVRFWTPEEWKRKGEDFANAAKLALTSEGGWNHVLYYGQDDELLREWNKLIGAAGYVCQTETCWAFGFYPISKDLVTWIVKNKRRNSDEDMRALARKAGEGNLIAAKKLAALIERVDPEVKVWVLTVVYDLDFVAFRSRDTMAESFVFASSDGVYAKMGIIIGRVIRYLADNEREPIEELLRAEDYAAAVEFYEDMDFHPATFWWNEMVVEG